jgi:hypothetical protein
MTTEREPVTMTVTLVDGTQRIFVFDHRPDGRLRLATRLDQLLSHHSLAIRLSEKLLVIPIAQVKTIEFTPSPDVQLEQLIGPARELQSNGVDVGTGLRNRTSR